MLDNGDLSTSEAIELIAADSSLKRDEIDEIFNLRMEICLPYPQNIKLLPELKEKGFRLYFLSNFPIDLWKLIRNGHNRKDYYFFSYFDGGVISAEVKLSKPDIRIYESLLEKYSLKPKNAFISMILK